jgi:hypothetical protein
MRKFCTGYATIAALPKVHLSIEAKMNQRSLNYIKIFIAITGLTLLTALNFFYFHDSVAQEKTTNFRAFFERARQRLIDETYFVLHIQFEHPLVVGGEAAWHIGDANAEYFRGIVEIGDDYVCFNELRGAAEGWLCTPFSNIVSVGFLNN